MESEGGARQQLLELVRSMTERIRLDGELGKPLSWLSQGKSGGTAALAEDQPGAGKGFTREPLSLEEVRRELGDCQRCPLGAQRRRLVFGEGNPRAEIAFVGEAPGADEDAQGKPFVGRAGQLLTKIISAMGLAREQVYICNILKCRPPGNRNPLPEEIATCEPFLVRQLQAIGPKVICGLGSVAVRTLLKTEAPISVLRGQFHLYQGIPLMPTYHPAYLLRNPAAKKQVWEDVQKIMRRLKEGTGNGEDGTEVREEERRP